MYISQKKKTKNIKDYIVSIFAVGILRNTPKRTSLWQVGSRFLVAARVRGDKKRGILNKDYDVVI